MLKNVKLINNKPLVVQQRRFFLKNLNILKVLKRQGLEEYKKKLLPRQRRRYNALPYNLKTTIPLFLKFPKNFTFTKSKKIYTNLSAVENLIPDQVVNTSSLVSSDVLESSEKVSKIPLLIIPGSSLYVSNLASENSLTDGKNPTLPKIDFHSKITTSLSERKINKCRSSKKKIDDSSFDYEDKSFDYYRGSTFLTLRPTRNNFFLTLWESSKGRMLINVSSGCVGFSGPDRVSEYAIKLLTLHFLRLIRIKKIRHFRIIVPDGAKSSSNVKRCLGILGEPSSGVQVSFVLHISSRAHNGCRGRKQRRV